jgi:hypothetical protein
MWDVQGSQKKLIIGLIKKIHQCCTEASSGDESVATAYVSRFTYRLLKKINVESRANSRHDSPSSADVCEDGSQLDVDTVGLVPPEQSFMLDIASIHYFDRRNHSRTTC